MLHGKRPGFLRKPCGEQETARDGEQRSIGPLGCPITLWRLGIGLLNKDTVLDTHVEPALAPSSFEFTTSIVSACYHETDITHKTTEYHRCIALVREEVDKFSFGEFVDEYLSILVAANAFYFKGSEQVGVHELQSIRALAMRRLVRCASSFGYFAALARHV